MGKGSSSKVVTAAAEPSVTPAIARSIAQDTESAQMLQAQDRERLRGISNTYRRYSSDSQQAAQGGNKTLGGN